MARFLWKAVSKIFVDFVFKTAKNYVSLIRKSSYY